MRALVLDSFEAGPQVKDVPVPAPGPGEVLVRVEAASINPVDAAVAFGALKDFYPHELPITLGRDFAGTVEAAGAGVDRYAPGDAVFGFVHVADPAVHAGSFAERIVIAQDASVAPRPAQLDAATAAVLPLAGTAALQSVEAVAPQAGKRVLVAGATGGVGRYAVQLAAARGAHVIATGLPADEADLRALGAAEVVDYTQDVAGAVRAAHADGVAGLVYLLQPPADFAALAALVPSGGRIATTVHAADVEALAAAGVTATNVMATADAALLGRLGELAVSGALAPHVERTFALEQIPEGFAHLAAGKARGKLAVTFEAAA